MCAPTYHSVTRDVIPELSIEDGRVRVLAGSFGDVKGYRGKYASLDYYDIALEPGGRFELNTDPRHAAMVFTLLGDAVVAGQPLTEKTAAHLSEGTSLELEAGEEAVRVLFMSAPALHEPIAWDGPIVMNTEDELERAYEDMRQGSFIKSEIIVE